MDPLMLPHLKQTVLRKRPAACVAAFLAMAALMFAVMQADAVANGTRVVRDAKFETAALSRNGRLDIVEASASRHGDAIKHTVAMRAKVRPARKNEHPAILINTKGGRESDAEYVVFDSTIFELPKHDDAVAIGAATVTSKQRTWKYEFDATAIPGLIGSYGWAAVTQKGKNVSDIAPDKGYANSPE
jgi:hypothetical protein